MTIPFPGDDLPRAMWHCLRPWLFDHRYFRPEASPLAAVVDYGPPPAAFHALTEWKARMAGLPAYAGVPLEARHHAMVYDAGIKRRVRLATPPDGGEVGRHDYLLRTARRPHEVLCAAEYEDGGAVRHLTEDLEKLVRIRARLKLIIYRMSYYNPRRHRQFEARCLARVRAIEALIAAEPAYTTTTADGPPREDWLFIGFPWYRALPRHPAEARVQVHTLTTPGRAIVLSKPDWDPWEAIRDAC